MVSLQGLWLSILWNVIHSLIFTQFFAHYLHFPHLRKWWLVDWTAGGLQWPAELHILAPKLCKTDFSIVTSFRLRSGAQPSDFQPKCMLHRFVSMTPFPEVLVLAAYFCIINSPHYCTMWDSCGTFVMLYFDTMNGLQITLKSVSAMVDECMSVVSVSFR